MAITQISKIQVRRGLQQDLGRLAGGEFGWAVDTQRLYIGNGTLAEGAPISGITELVTTSMLTDSNLDTILGMYTYKGTLGGYTVTNTHSRGYQEKFDDIINVRDFGARGTGSGDDLPAIQRALDEIYNRNQGGTIMPYQTRRALRFTGGVYSISGELRIPPHVTLIGDGRSSVVISLTSSSSATCLIRATTNLGLTPNDPNNVNFEYPSYLHISGITFQTSAATDIVRLDSATNCKFENVNFVGPIDEPDGTETRNTCVSVSSLAAQSTGIVFRDCGFSGLSYGVTVGANVDGLVFDDCTFNNLFQAVVAPTILVPPKNIKITNSRFKDIFSSAILGGIGVTGIVSSNNVYTNVGNHYVPESNGVEVVPVIVFQANNNYSIADTFSRSIANSNNVPRVSSAGYAVISAAIDDAFALGSSHQLPGRQVTLVNGIINYIVIPYITHGIIDYSIRRGTIIRSGTIKFVVQPGQPPMYDEEYTENSNIGITTSLTSLSGATNLIVTLSNLGLDATLNFDVKTLH